MLEIKNINKSFGGISALSDVSFNANEREIKAVIGPNGAGKTTLLHIISGIYPPDGGEVIWSGNKISGMSSVNIARKGISRTFQHVELFGHLTVLENVMIGRHMRTKAGFIASGLKLPFVGREERKIKAKSEEILDLVGLRNKEYELASTLPIGEERMLEIARALATEPQLLLLDEPASGLNEAETNALSVFITNLKTNLNLTIMLVEHDMGLVMNISDSIVVLDFGEKLAEGLPEDIRNNKLVIDAYLGDEDI
ncbi:MAG: ABC transporter ATP-binding protein [Nitrospirae bacterium]|nr:ABC transporter ATP-binding protein [Nitrospirota bacterium]